jgi:hypothetical protein
MNDASTLLLAWGLLGWVLALWAHLRYLIASQSPVTKVSETPETDPRVDK